MAAPKPPPVLYVRIHTDNGAYREAHLTRASADEAVELWRAQPKGPGPRTGVAYTVVEYVPREPDNGYDALREAVDTACTCGGAGPSDGCPACQVWHFMRTKPPAPSAQMAFPCLCGLFPGGGSACLAHPKEDAR
jgi:hypothetical protein